MEKGRRPCFYEVFSPNSTSQCLRIPVGFVKHLAGRLSGTVYLFGPSGDVWPVGLARVNGNLVLGNGWSDFVRDHCLESGDLLVLRYDGDARFDVQVFDQSTCVKEAAFGSVRGQGLGATTDVGGKRVRGEDGGEEVSLKRARGSYSESEDKYWEDGIGVPDQGRGPQDGGVGNNTCLDVCLFRGDEECESPSRNSVLISQLVNWNDKAESESSVGKGNGKDGDLGPNEKNCGSIFLEQEKRVAQSFNSCFPYFVRIMKKFNVNGSYTLNLPYQFATEHLPNCKTEIVLRTIKGGCWMVNSVPTTRVHTSHTLCGGWMAFVRNNGVRIGDACIFELIRKFELRVFILQVGKEGQDDQNIKVETMGNIGPTGARKPERLSKNSQNNSLKVHSRHIKKVELCDKNGCKKVQATSLTNHTGKSGDPTNAATRRKNGEMVSLQAQFGLRAIVAGKEDEAAKNFVSGFPSFVRIMKKFNISGSYTLKIPYQFSTAYLPNCKTEITLRNMQGNSWIVNSVPNSKGRSVHTFCGGWMAFVCDNDIQIEDICMFELVSHHEMQVQISGTGRRALDAKHEVTARSSTDSCIPASELTCTSTGKSITATSMTLGTACTSMTTAGTTTPGKSTTAASQEPVPQYQEPVPEQLLPPGREEQLHRQPQLSTSASDKREGIGHSSAEPATAVKKPKASSDIATGDDKSSATPGASEDRGRQLWLRLLKFLSLHSQSKASLPPFLRKSRKFLHND